MSPHGSEQGVVAGDVEGGATDLDRGVHAGAGVARVSQGGKSAAGRGIQRAETMAAGGGDVVDAARFDRSGPDGEPRWVGDDLHVAALGFMLARVPQVVAVLVAAGDPRSISINMPSMDTRDQPNCRPCSSTSCRSGACSAITSIASCR